jgi:hypothetical protein
LTTLATGWRWHDDLPDPMATHWTLAGEVDDTLPPAVLLTVALVASVGLAVAAVVAVVAAGRARGDRLVAVALTWAAWLGTSVFVVPAWLSRGAVEAEAVTLHWWAVLVVPLLPTLAALTVAGLLPATPVAPTTPGRRGSPLHLREGERAVWLGSAASGRMLLLAGALLVGAVFVVFTAWPLANAMALVSLVLFWLHVVSLRVDDSGLTVAWGPARWPRVHVPLEQVTAVRSEHVEPLRWGGWGYRRTLRATAAVSRRGPGIVVERRGRVPLVVTVDNPEGAVDLVEAMLDRQQRAASARPS